MRNHPIIAQKYVSALKHRRKFVRLRAVSPTRAIWNAVNHWANTMPAHISGRNDPYAPAQCIVEVLFPRPANPAHAHLDNTLYPRHFTCAPHRAGKRVTRAVSFLSPVEVCIHLNDRERSVRLKRLEEGNGNRIVTTEKHRYSRRVENHARSFSNQVAIAARV